MHVTNEAITLYARKIAKAIAGAVTIRKREISNSQK
jgi:hypothetical protein